MTHGVWKGNIPVGSFYTTGQSGEAFFAALKERGEILGSRCGACGVTYVPARIFCERCFAKLDPSVKVKPEGELVSFTIARVDMDGKPLEKPRAVAAVRLDGADTVMIHNLLGDPAKTKIGARVRVALESKRTGTILDIKGFEPI